MPATTAKGYPYPLGTDRLMDGDDAIHSLATAVDTLVGTSAGGTVTWTAPIVGTPGSMAVTFPVGRFVAIPWVTISPFTAAPERIALGFNGVTASGFTAWATRLSSSGTIVANWHARALD